MATIDKLKKIRLKKLAAIKRAGIYPYPIKTKRTHKISEALSGFSTLSKSKKEVVLAGRMRSLRVHGGATFFHIQDGTGSIQALIRKDGIGQSSYRFFLENFDIGDFLELRGVMIKTKRGEKTIDVSHFKILAKGLRPLPEKWHGLKNVEERFRKRYLDLIFNPEVKKSFILGSKIIQEIRNFLSGQGFIEVETPILQPTYGGARAKPFKTRLNAFDIDLYLRISPELYLKRLLVGGFEKVFEIGKCFRNEGVDRFHNPDFTMLEFYWAYADYKDLMKLTEKMFALLLKKFFKKTTIEYQGEKIDFSLPWTRVEYCHLFSRETGIDYDSINRDALSKEAKKMGIKIEKGSPKFEIADEIFKKKIRPKIKNPTFVIHFPYGFQTLAKSLEKEPSRLANFQLIVSGTELVNAFSELNDPLEQRKRFKEQRELLRQGYGEAHPFDKDFLQALEYGMPPAAGFGMGINRLIMLLTDSHSLREAILFPTMKAKK